MIGAAEIKSQKFAASAFGQPRRGDANPAIRLQPCYDVTNWQARGPAFAETTARQAVR